MARLAAQAQLPPWAAAPAVLHAVVRTATELSVITDEGVIPAEVRAERGYRALRVRGPLPFHLTGILASLAQPLAEGGIPIFALSTFDTDYLLVKEDDLGRARVALTAAGHALADE